MEDGDVDGLEYLNFTCYVCQEKNIGNRSNYCCNCNAYQVANSELVEAVLVGEDGRRMDEIPGYFPELMGREEVEELPRDRVMLNPEPELKFDSLDDSLKYLEMLSEPINTNLVENSPLTKAASAPTKTIKKSRRKPKKSQNYLNEKERERLLMLRLEQNRIKPKKKKKRKKKNKPGYISPENQLLLEKLCAKRPEMLIHNFIPNHEMVNVNLDLEEHNNMERALHDSKVQNYSDSFSRAVRGLTSNDTSITDADLTAEELESINAQFAIRESLSMQEQQQQQQQQSDKHPNGKDALHQSHLQPHQPVPRSSPQLVPRLSPRQAPRSHESPPAALIYSDRPLVTPPSLSHPPQPDSHTHHLHSESHRSEVFPRDMRSHSLIDSSQQQQQQQQQRSPPRIPCSDSFNARRQEQHSRYIPPTAPRSNSLDGERRIEINKPPNQQQWSCGFCTLENVVSLERCAACGVARVIQKELQVQSSCGEGTQSKFEPAETRSVKVKQKQWACRICTFENEMSSNECAICTLARPVMKGSQRPAAHRKRRKITEPHEERSSKGSKLWTCGVCTLENEISTKTCTACFGLRSLSKVSQRSSIREEESKVAEPHERRKRKVVKQWICGLCTFRNDLSAELCATCSAVRPVEKERQGLPAHSGDMGGVNSDEPHEDLQQWECAVCTFKNDVSTKVCDACMGMRPVEREQVNDSCENRWSEVADQQISWQPPNSEPSRDVPVRCRRCNLVMKEGEYHKHLQSCLRSHRFDIGSSVDDDLARLSLG